MSDYAEPIFITGAARSRTSLVAGAMDVCGAFGGEVRPPNKANPKGMFENKQIVSGIIKPYLTSMGCDPLGQKSFPCPQNLRPILFLRQQVLNIMISEGLERGKPWYYKAVKMCLIWPLWIKAFPDARWIIVRRNADDIAASCLRTHFMRAYQTKEGWLRWVRIHEERFNEMKGADIQFKEIWTDNIVQGDFSSLQETIEWAGLTWKPKSISSFITLKEQGKSGNNGG